MQGIQVQFLVRELDPTCWNWKSSAAAAAKWLQSCLTLCDPIDGSPWGSSVPGILQARTLEWVVISFSSAWKWKVKVKSLSRVQLFTTPWTAAHQAPPSMGFSRQECYVLVNYISYMKLFLFVNRYFHIYPFPAAFLFVNNNFIIDSCESVWSVSWY